MESQTSAVSPLSLCLLTQDVGPSLQMMMAGDTQHYAGNPWLGTGRPALIQEAHLEQSLHICHFHRSVIPPTGGRPSAEV